MNNDDFDRWCAELMGWEEEVVDIVYQGDEGPAPDYEYWWKRPDGEYLLQGVWSPSNDLNDMREVELRVIEMGHGLSWHRALSDLLLEGKGHVFSHLLDQWLATASVEQRKAAIISIKPQIEEATNGDNT